MSSDIIIIEAQKTWQPDVVRYFNENYALLRAWANREIKYEETFDIVKSYDQFIYGLSSIISKYFLHGFHCTRLTQNEIDIIYSDGMSLPDELMLEKRIVSLRKQGLITSTIAESLIIENQAHEKNRRGMIWFCFFQPYLVGQMGIERLFRSWGGEALFNSHENNPDTNIYLNSIGIPCVVEARIQISTLNINSLSILLTKHFMFNSYIVTEKPGAYEDNTKFSISSANIYSYFKIPGKKVPSFNEV